MLQGFCRAGLAVVALTAPAFAQDSRISADRSTLTFMLNGQQIEVARSGPACPPDCVQPMQAAPDVATVGELEVLDFLQFQVATGRGLLVDTRLPEGFALGTLPGAVNVPGATLGPDNPYREDLLNALGVRSGDFTQAFDLVLFSGGADRGEAADALRSLLDAGYPAQKLKFYRGGLAAWMALGLTVASGE